MSLGPKGTYTLLSKMGYKGPVDQDEMAKFVQSSPSVASKLGRFDKALKGRAGMYTGGVVTSGEGSWAGNGDNRFWQQVAAPATQDTAAVEAAKETTAGSAPDKWVASDWTNPNVSSQMERYEGETIAWEGAFKEARDELEAAKAQLDSNPSEVNKAKYNKALRKLEGINENSPTDQGKKYLEGQAVWDPESLVRRTDVAQMGADEGTEIASGTGQVSSKAPKGNLAQATATTADAAAVDDAQTYNADQAEDRVTSAAEGMEGATSEVGRMATVKGQYEELMKDFEDGTPPWASPAMRASSARMQSRGLGASSMAGQAIVQAAMEAALPIAAQDAATYAQREMANLSNEQQTRILKSQFRFNAILSDQSAMNAARQFNATSVNQMEQFRANMETQVSQFNAAQINTISQFNAGQANAMTQFNAQLQDQRDKFNAQNSLVVAQANTQWRQQITTQNTAYQNQANMYHAQVANALTGAALDQYWQEERDKMAFAFQEKENALDRQTELLLGQMAKPEKPGFGAIAGAVAGKALGSAIGGMF